MKPIPSRSPLQFRDMRKAIPVRLLVFSKEVASSMRAIGLGLCIVLLAILTVGSAGAQAPASSAGIFVADDGNNRVVRIDDMTGAGWITLGGPAAGPGTNGNFANRHARAAQRAGQAARPANL